MWSKVKGWILGIVAALFMLVYILKQAVSAGEDKIQRENLEEVMKNVDEAKKTNIDTNDMSTDSRIERMRERSRK